MRRLELILGISFALVACRERTRDPEPESLIEDVRIAGCEQIRRGPICEIENDTKVVLWVQAAPESRLSVEGTEVEWTEVDGGWRTTFEVTTATKSIDVIATRKGRDKYALPVVVWKRPPWLVRADALRTKSATTALAILDANEEGADVRTLADVATMRAKIAFGRLPIEDVIELRQTSHHVAEHAELVSASLNALGALTWIGIVITRDVDAVRKSLIESRRRVPLSIGAEPAHVELYESMLAREVGDPLRALRFALKAESQGRRLADHRMMQATQVRADVLGALGKYDEVGALYRQMSLEVPHPSQPCDRARLLANRSWAGYVSREAGYESPFDPLRDAQQALELYRGACSNPANVRNVLVTLALEALRSHELGRAEAWIVEAERTKGPQALELDVWLMVARARLAAERDDLDSALAQYAALDDLGRHIGAPSIRWRAELGRADLYRRAGREGDASSAYARAESILDATGDVPFAGPGHRFDVHAQSSAARQYAELQRMKGAYGRAAVILERHALRSRRGIERGFRVAALQGRERRAWEQGAMRYQELRRQLDAIEAEAWADAVTNQRARARRKARLEEEIRTALEAALVVLGPPHTVPVERGIQPPGHVDLTIDRVESGWFAFVETSKGTRWVALDHLESTSDSDALADQILRPLSSELEGATVLRVAARGIAHRIDVHALPWQGRPLLSTVAVTYSVGGRGVHRASAGGRVAVVVDDSTGNLPVARDEADAVSECMRATGFSVRQLRGRAVTRSGITNALRGADHLHWAGHGRADDDPLYFAQLALAGGASFDVGDILTLPEVPRTVVLSGCATAADESSEIGPTRAFVLAGVEAVVATTRPVRDELAAFISSRLYSEESPPLWSALRQAQLAAMKDNADSDWAAFRVYVP